MIRHVCAVLLVLASVAVKSQCPRIYNYLGALTYTPQFINCNGNAYVVNFQSDVSFGSYTVSWGDGSPNHSGAAYNANTTISHTYAAATNSYILTFTTGSCVLTGTVVNEQPALASIIVPSGVGSTLCAPKTLTFSNATTFTSTSTTYTWYFGDGSPPEVHTYTNAGQNVTHTYQKGTVNCVTQVSLLAQNYCNFTPSSNSFGPLQVFDIDDAQVSASQLIKCLPDNQFTFNNTTNRNCLPQGNTSQRYERWNLGDYWGLGHDSIIDWSPWPPTTPVTVAFPPVGGSYSVMLLDSNMCGTDAAVINVFLINPPVAGLQTPTVALCQNTPVTFTNTSSGAPQYRWNFGAGGGFQTLAGTTRTFTYTSPGTYTVQLVALVPGGGGPCTDTAVGVVNILPAPTVSFAASPAAGCGSLSVNFSDQSSGAAAWNWSFGNGATSTLQTPATQDYTTPGTYVATLNVASASGCTRSATTSLIVRHVPVASFNGSVACQGAPLHFTNTSFVGAGSITGYTWTFGDGSGQSTATDPSHSYTALGTYTVRLKATTAFCEDSTEQPVTIFVKPTASFVMTPTTGCPPFTATLSNLSQDAASYLWRFGSAPGATASTTGAIHTYTNATQGFLNYSVTLVAISPAGCTDSTFLPVQVRPKPVASFTSNTVTGCSPLVTTFSNTSLGAFSHAWLFGDGVASSLQHPSHTYTNTTLFTQTVIATLLVTNSVTCTDTATQLITIYPEALSVFSMVPAMGCSPLNVNFPSVPGVATYSWDHGDGSPTFTTLTAHNYTYSNNGLTDKTFTVHLNALTTNGCSGSASGTLVVYHNPVADFTISSPAGCTPLQTTFHNTSSGNPDTLAWTFGNGFTSNNQIVATTFTNGAGGGQQNFNATLKIRTQQGCTDSITKQVTVYPQPKAAFTPDTPACSPAVVGFFNSSQGANSFQWHFGDGTSATGDSASHVYINATGNPEDYPARLVATSVNMCRDSVTVNVRIYPKPEFLVAATPEEGCSPLSVFFPKISGVAQYEWKYDNSIGFGSAGDIINTFENKTPAIKIFTVQLVARDIHSCADTSLKFITVYPRPDARFTARPLSVFIPDQAVNFVNESSNAASYTWDFGDGNTSEAVNPVHFYKAPGEYRVVLIATTDLGCPDTFALAETVIALEETVIQMPNAFTPNPSGSPGTFFDPRDTSNDIFHPNVKGAEKFTFSIYSRWGELLFETRNPAEGWDGYYKGKLCTPDVYIWKVTATFIDGKTFNKTGDVLLLR